MTDIITIPDRLIYKEDSANFSVYDFYQEYPETEGFLGTVISESQYVVTAENRINDFASQLLSIFGAGLPKPVLPIEYTGTPLHGLFSAFDTVNTEYDSGFLNFVSMSAIGTDYAYYSQLGDIGTLRTEGLYDLLADVLIKVVAEYYQEATADVKEQARYYLESDATILVEQIYYQLADALMRNQAVYSLLAGVNKFAYQESFYQLATAIIKSDVFYSILCDASIVDGDVYSLNLDAIIRSSDLYSLIGTAVIALGDVYYLTGSAKVISNVVFSQLADAKIKEPILTFYQECTARIIKQLEDGNVTEYNNQVNGNPVQVNSGIKDDTLVNIYNRYPYV